MNTNSSSEIDLNIQNYNLEEILALFNLKDENITSENLSIAKKKLLSMHPDKSNLPPKYFIFFKKGFDILKELYLNNSKVDKKATEENTTYKCENDTEVAISQSIDSITDKKIFNVLFNELFEKNYSSLSINSSKNNWFQRHDEEPPITKKDINQNIAEFKLKQQSKNKGNIIKINPVRSTSSTHGTKLYEDDDDEYIICNSSSTLKYEDIRRVHRDETVFNVDESIKFKLQKIEELTGTRKKQDMLMMNYDESNAIIENEKKINIMKIKKLEYASKLIANSNEEKNQKVLSCFLRLMS